MTLAGVEAAAVEGRALLQAVVGVGVCLEQWLARLAFAITTVLCALLQQHYGSRH